MDLPSEFSRVKKYEYLRNEVKNNSSLIDLNTYDNSEIFDNNKLIKPLLIYKNSKYKNQLVKEMNFQQKNISDAIVSSQIIIEDLNNSTKQINAESLLTNYKDILKNKHFLSPDLHNATSFYQILQETEKNINNQIDIHCEETFKKFKKYNLACLYYLRNKKYSYMLAVFFLKYKKEKNAWNEFCKKNNSTINYTTKKQIDSLLIDLECNFSKLNKFIVYVYKYWKISLAFLPFISVIIFQKFGWNFKKHNVK